MKVDSPPLQHRTTKSTLPCKQQNCYVHNASVDAIAHHDLGAVCYRYLQARELQHAAAVRFALRPVLPCVYAAKFNGLGSLACPLTYLTIFGGPCDVQSYHSSQTTKRACKAVLIAAMGGEAEFRALVGSQKQGLQRAWNPTTAEKLAAANIPSETFQALCERRGARNYKLDARALRDTLPKPKASAPDNRA